MTADDNQTAALFTAITIRAAAVILQFDCRNIDTRRKADQSLVTAADEAAERVILAGLAKELPDVPVVSEESAAQWSGMSPGKDFVLVDPLDGTAEFLAGRDEYTVNIALVRNGVPVVGVVAAPALGLVWRGTAGSAERLRVSTSGEIAEQAAIHTRRWPMGERIAAVSRTHFDAVSAAFLQRLSPVKEVAYGSALKFARIAEGVIDIYPRLAPTSEWDVAAGHAVVIAAGGAVVAADGGALHYGRSHVGFRVEGFTAWGDIEAAQRLAG